MHEGDGFSAKTLLSDRAMVRPASSVKWKTPLDFFLTLNGPSPLGSRGYFLISFMMVFREQTSEARVGPSQLESIKA